MNRLLNKVGRFPAVLFKLLLCLSASSYVVVIFLVKEKYRMSFLQNCQEGISYVVYILVPVIMTRACIFLSKYLMADGVENQIRGVELGSNTFLPSYLGYFFVALSVPDTSTLYVVFAIIYVFTYLSQSVYFNPLFLLFRYQFYFVTTQNDSKILLITRQNMKNYKYAKLDDLRRINDFTFIDMKK